MGTVVDFIVILAVFGGVVIYFARKARKNKKEQ